MTLVPDPTGPAPADPAPASPVPADTPPVDPGRAPGAGWYPSGTGTGRAWWNGSAWTDGDASRPAPTHGTTSRPAAAPLPADSYLGAHDVPAAVNPPARLGLVLGVVGIVVNPVLLVGVAAIVVSAIGLRRAGLMGAHGYPAVGRGRALGGVALGLVATVLSIAVKRALW